MNDYTYYRDFTAEQKAWVIETANRWRHRVGECRLDENNVDRLLDLADAISRRKLGQPLGPFWMCAGGFPYDTPYSGWASLSAARCRS